MNNIELYDYFKNNKSKIVFHFEKSEDVQKNFFDIIRGVRSSDKLERPISATFFIDIGNLTIDDFKRKIESEIKHVFHPTKYIDVEIIQENFLELR